MDDLIRRQDAIDELISEPSEMNYGFYYAEKIKALPSVQSKIIRCGDCKYKDDGIDEDGVPFLKCLHGRSYGGTRINDFCSWAERRVNKMSDKLRSWNEFVSEMKEVPEGAVPTDVACPCCGNRLYKDTTIRLICHPSMYKYFCNRVGCKWYGFA